MKKFAWVMVVVLVLTNVVVPVFAGGPPVLAVSVPTGLFADWGQEIVHDALLWIGPDNPYSATFNQSWGAYYSESSSWSALKLGDNGGLYSEAGMNAAPSTVEGFLWSGLTEPRAEFTLNVTMLADPILVGDPWGTRLFSIFASDGSLLRQTTLGTGNRYWSTTLAANPTSLGDVSLNAYRWKLETVPEPSSLLAIGSSLIGLGGFAVRRRRVSAL